MDLVKCCGGNLVCCHSKREFESQTFAHIKIFQAAAEIDVPEKVCGHACMQRC